MDYKQIFEKFTSKTIPPEISFSILDRGQFISEMEAKSEEYGLNISTSSWLSDAQGMFIHPANDFETGTVIINRSAIEDEYELDEVAFHELGHTVTISKFLMVINNEDILIRAPATVLKEVMACYYAHKCLNEIYEEPVSESVIIEYFDNFAESSRKISYSPTDYGNVAGTILVYYYDFINDNPDILQHCDNPELAEAVYEYACTAKELLDIDTLSINDIQVFAKAFANIIPPV